MTVTVFWYLNLFNIDFERFYCSFYSLIIRLFEKKYQTLETKKNCIGRLLMQNVFNVILNSLGHLIKRELENAEMQMSFAERSCNILKLLN